jgi:heterodisulfide reductase subunit C
MTKLAFRDEVANLLHAAYGKSLDVCVQCGTCSGTCPVADYMDQTPRKLIGMIRADLKDEVLASNTYWYCASCYHCTVRCPAGIDIAGFMYALKRYTIWKHIHKEGLVGPNFSETFVKTIIRSGRSYEPVLATTVLFSTGMKDVIQEAVTATNLMLKGRMPVIPSKIKRLANFKRMIGRVIPLGESS